MVCIEVVSEIPGIKLCFIVGYSVHSCHEGKGLLLEKYVSALQHSSPVIKISLIQAVIYRQMSYLCAVTTTEHYIHSVPLL